MLFTETNHWPHVTQNCLSLVCTSGSLAKLNHWAGETGVSAPLRGGLEGLTPACVGTPETGAAARAAAVGGTSVVCVASGCGCAGSWLNSVRVEAWGV